MYRYSVFLRDGVHEGRGYSVSPRTSPRFDLAMNLFLKNPNILYLPIFFVENSLYLETPGKRKSYAMLGGNGEKNLSTL